MLKRIEVQRRGVGRDQRALQADLKPTIGASRDNLAECLLDEDHSALPECGVVRRFGSEDLSRAFNELAAVRDAAVAAMARQEPVRQLELALEPCDLGVDVLDGLL
ncbi:MAG TPA: hypothetical protein VGO80_18680 [Solirubrobacteraceae bacterium]|nr:hypothetical protein [Solirubrobacteraceae bacterium]